MTPELAVVDALLAADKRLFRAPEWSESRGGSALSSPLVDDAGSILGGVSLRFKVIDAPTFQLGGGALVYGGQPIQRFSFRPDHPHTNPPRAEMAVRFRRLPAGRSRIYLWRDNRVWPTTDNLGVARVIDPEPPTIAEAIAHFLATCSISADIPPPAWRPRLDFE